jgi:hypothetical protein
MAQAAFEINGEVIPFTTSPRLKDARLVEKITGLTFSEYAEREKQAQERIASGAEQSDPMVLIGLIAMSVSRMHPDWNDARVVEFCDEIEFGGLVTVGGDADPPADEASPEASLDLSAEPETMPETG